jgi:multidrug efflux system membrane fusion protein
MRYHFSICAYVIIAGYSLIGCQRSKAPPPEHTVPVVVEEAVATDVPLFIDVIGNVYSPMTVEIRPQISGKLLSAHVNQGDDVLKGQLLYSIDPDPFQAVLDKARATLIKDEALLEYAKSTLERYKDLVKKDYVSKLNYDQYVSNFAAAKAQVESDLADIRTAEINLGYTSIFSPIDGRMSGYTVDPGNIVSPTDTNPLTTVRQITPIHVYFYLPQSDFQKVKDLPSFDQLTFDATVPGLADHEVNGRVFFVDNNINLQTGSILL